MAIPQPQAPNCLDYCHIPHTTPRNHHLFILFICLEGDADKDLMRGAPLSQTQLQSLIFKRWSRECHLHRNLPNILEIPRRLLGQGCKTQFLLDLPLSKLCYCNVTQQPQPSAQEALKTVCLPTVHKPPRFKPTSLETLSMVAFLEVGSLGRAGRE